MNDDERNQEALFRHSILGELLSRKLRRGQLRAALRQLSQQTYQDPKGRSRRVVTKRWRSGITSTATGASRR